MGVKPVASTPTRIILSVTVVLLLLLAGVQTVTANVYLGGGEEITVVLGETEQYQITLHNPHDQRETYDLQIDTEMQNGELAASVSSDVGGEQGQVDVAPGQNRTVPITYTASQCAHETCDGSVTILARSITDRHTYSDTTSVMIERPAPMRGAPGVTALQLLAITAIASLVFYAGHRRPQRRER